MEYILKFKDLEKYFKKADFTDVKVFEGNTTLRRFILIRPFHHLVVSLALTPAGQYHDSRGKMPS